MSREGLEKRQRGKASNVINVVICVLMMLSIMGVVFVGIGTGCLLTVSPGSGAVTALITLTGSGFGDTQGASKVLFNKVDAGIAYSWSPGVVQARVPIGAVSGNVWIMFADGSVTNSKPFVVTGNPCGYESDRFLALSTELMRCLEQRGLPDTLAVPDMLQIQGILRAVKAGTYRADTGTSPYNANTLTKFNSEILAKNMIGEMEEGARLLPEYYAIMEVIYGPEYGKQAMASLTDVEASAAEKASNPESEANAVILGEPEWKEQLRETLEFLSAFYDGMSAMNELLGPLGKLCEGVNVALTFGGTNPLEAYDHQGPDIGLSNVTRVLKKGQSFVEEVQVKDRSEFGVFSGIQSVTASVVPNPTYPSGVTVALNTGGQENIRVPGGFSGLPIWFVGLTVSLDQNSTLAGGTFFYIKMEALDYSGNPTSITRTFKVYEDRAPEIQSVSISPTKVFTKSQMDSATLRWQVRDQNGDLRQTSTIRVSVSGYGVSYHEEWYNANSFSPPLNPSSTTWQNCAISMWSFSPYVDFNVTKWVEIDITAYDQTGRASNTGVVLLNVEPYRKVRIVAGDNGTAADDTFLAQFFIGGEFEDQIYSPNGGTFDVTIWIPADDTSYLNVCWTWDVCGPDVGTFGIAIYGDGVYLANGYTSDSITFNWMNNWVTYHLYTD